MGVLIISEYQVATNRSRLNNGAHRFAIILKGTAQSGPCNHAVIYFWPSKPADTVGYVTGRLFVGQLDDSDFQYWYDILRHEKPVKLYYTEDRSSEIRVHHVSLGTTDEALGEGPADSDA